MANVTFLNKQGRVTVECQEEETLLQAGLRQGVPLPYGCGAGVCSTCVARARPGTVRDGWPEAPGAKNLKREKGECLLCQSTVAADCEILVPGKLVLTETTGQNPLHQSARLKGMQTVAPDVATFQLELDKPIDFMAGQYLLLRLPGMEGYRPYSMTSFDANTRQATFVIKRFPGGRFSEALFAGGAAEYRVDVFGPMGLATFDPGENRDLICLVGGSGIAGIMSILSQAASLDYFKKHRLTIVFGVRRLEDFFFIEELKVVQKSAPEHIQINLAISDFQAGGSVDSQVHGFALHHGFVHEVAEQLNGNVFSERLAFLGGPPAMLTGSLALLLGVGTPVADIRYDKFG